MMTFVCVCVHRDHCLPTLPSLGCLLEDILGWIKRSNIPILQCKVVSLLTLRPSILILELACGSLTKCT